LFLVVDCALLRRLVANCRAAKRDGHAWRTIGKGAVRRRAARVSIGQSAMVATLGVVKEIAAEMREHGTWRRIEQSFYGFGAAKSCSRGDESDHLCSMTMITPLRGCRARWPSRPDFAAAPRRCRRIVKDGFASPLPLLRRLVKDDALRRESFVVRVDIRGSQHETRSEPAGIDWNQ